MATVEFRDGWRDVPEHVEAILKGIQTYSLTYDEAIAAANRRMASDYLERGLRNMREQHFRNFGVVRR